MRAAGRFQNKNRYCPNLIVDNFLGDYFIMKQATNDHPEHMDKWSRNARLYESLKDSGLFVQPVYHHNDKMAIDYLMVSTGLLDQQYQG